MFSNNCERECDYKYVPQKCQTIKFVPIRCVLSSCMKAPKLVFGRAAPDPAEGDYDAA